MNDESIGLNELEKKLYKFDIYLKKITQNYARFNYIMH